MSGLDDSATSVVIERCGPVLVLTLDGPSSRNSIGPDIYNAVQGQVIAAGADPQTRAVVLTGSGGFFSAGGNVKALRESASGTLAEATARTDRLNAMIMAIANCPVPVLAAIEGGAAGAGLSLALACDMIVASENARFAVAQVRVGLSPDGGATSFLRSALPRQIVMEMCLLGLPISADRLAGFGLINVLAPEGGALEAALDLAAHLAEGPPQAIRTIKTLVQSAATADLASQLDSEARAINLARFSAEAAEGLAAFLEKRPTRFGSGDGAGGEG